MNAAILKSLVAASLVAVMLPGSVAASTQLALGDVVALSDNGGAFKPKLVRLSSGRLVVAYGDFLALPEQHRVYDVKDDAERPARDVFVRTCNAGATDCADPASWSAPINVSGTAALSSMDADWTGSLDGTDAREPFHGDSDKPNLFSSGNRVVVTWTDKYCPDGDPATAAADPPVQRSVTYRERADREIPFSCVYAVASSDGGSTWGEAVQLTSAVRDAKQDVSRGLGSGQWGIVWQEDPLGLQLGEAEGPGDGASGARASNGTDIWYSYASAGWSDDDGGAFGIWHAPARLTDNVTRRAAGRHALIRDVTGAVVPDEEIDGGIAGASRPNLAVQFNDTLEPVAQAIVAYEETKGSAGLAEGKFVRYETFDWNLPVASAGCIVSDPTLNARRARIVPQRGPGKVSGLRLALLWREGAFVHGGPADIRVRKGAVSSANGFSTAELDPPVDPGCVTSDFQTAVALAAAPGLNVSSRTLLAEPTLDGDIATSTLADDTNQKVEENALAHRAQLRGDDLYVGYGYTHSLAELLYTNTANYNFYFRHYDAAAGLWDAPVNASGITDTSINMREPRLLATPGNGPGCADPASPTDPEDCQDRSVFYVAWGTQTNVSEWSREEVRDLALAVARAERKGDAMTRTVHLGTVENPVLDDEEEFESQLRPTPAGNVLYAVWSERDAGGDTTALFRVVSTFEEPDPPVLPAEDGDGDEGFFGCSYRPGAGVDPTLPLLLAAALALRGLARRRRTG